MSGKYSYYQKRVARLVGIMLVWIIPILFISPIGAANVTIEKIAFEGWTDCYRVTNGEVELVAVNDVGPRVLRLGFVDGDNLFLVDPQTAGKSGGDQWVSYGGHRLWVGPELADVTYYPDNFQGQTAIDGNKLTLTAPIEILDDSLRKSLSADEIEKKAEQPDFRKLLRFRKQMEITMENDGRITVVHSLTNCGLQTFELAPWALTVMNPGGICITANPPYAPHGPGHWLPERAIVTWSYTNMVDPRIKWMKKYITFRQDTSISAPLKFGFSNTQGWVAYARKEQLFVKNLNYDEKATYPDMGCSVEIFTNNSMMEVESLGPLVTLKPGETTTHTERWRLLKIQPITQDEDSIDQMLKAVDVNP